MFRTKTKLKCTEKKYNIIITNLRVLLYSERGRFFKSPDVISERLESIYGIEYNEEVKPVFNFIQSIINKVDNPFIRRLDDS